jgi:D-alanine-D-alanine ligase
MHVMIAYNEPVLSITHPDSESERDILGVVQTISALLEREGFEVEQYSAGRDFSSFRERLRSSRPDAVFNLFEGLGDDPHSECRFARLLEDEGVAFTGCPSRALWLAGRKDIAKGLFQEAALPTPRFLVAERLPLTKLPRKLPVIVKPAFRDASLGIDQASIATDAGSLHRRVEQISHAYGFPILIEEFIDGREISVAVIDWPQVQVLPEVETLFVERNGDWPIVSYDSKWRIDSRDYRSTPLRYPAELSRAVAEHLRESARTAYLVLECRDLVTIDFRLASDGTPYLLEVNPNSGLAPSPCLMWAFEAIGLPYDDYLLQMVESAHNRKSRASQLASRI